MEQNRNMMDVITTHELHRIEAATPTTTAAQKVRFWFNIGYNVIFETTAEVVVERHEGGAASYDVTILTCTQHNGTAVLYPYQKGMESLRAALEQSAISYVR